MNLKKKELSKKWSDSILHSEESILHHEVSNLHIASSIFHSEVSNLHSEGALSEITTEITTETIIRE